MREDKRIRKKIGKKEIPVSFVHQKKKNPDGNDNLRDVKKKNQRKQ